MRFIAGTYNVSRQLTASVARRTTGINGRPAPSSRKARQSSNV